MGDGVWYPTTFKALKMGGVSDKSLKLGDDVLLANIMISCRIPAINALIYAGFDVRDACKNCALYRFPMYLRVFVSFSSICDKLRTKSQQIILY